MKQWLLLGVSCLSLLFSQALCTKAIIFDIGDTLIKRDNLKIGYHVGFYNGLRMWLGHGSNLSKRSSELLMATLADGTETEDAVVVLDAKGNVMPHIIQDWFKGHKTSADVLAYGLERAQEYPFESEYERNFIMSTMQWMFNPELMAPSHYPVSGGLDLLQKLSLMKDASGSSMHTFYIISNYDKESYEVLRRHMPELFAFFDEKNIEVSAFVHTMKPHHNIFIDFMNKHELQPADCVFIDDQYENIEAALELGIDAIHIIKHDFVNVENELKNRGILVETDGKHDEL